MLQKKSNDRCLIISLSARALAGALTSAGYSVTAIDCFCDQDLTAGSCHKLSSFDTKTLLRTIKKEPPFDYLIYGGGLESCPEFLEQLPKGLTILGNSGRSLKAISDPYVFFKLLKNNKIPYPEITFSPPENSEIWLVKQVGTSGGLGVEYFIQKQAYPSSYYFQKFITGSVYSVLFISNAQNTQIVGYNELLKKSEHSFLFAGAISLPKFSKHLDKQIRHYVQTLSVEFNLKGLGGMDFIIDKQEKIHVLEINPRPTATFELHDQKGDLLERHIQACRYGILKSDNVTRSISTRSTPTGSPKTFGKKIIYSEKKLRLRGKISWPEWTADRPHKGQLVNSDEPICTIYAEGDNREEVYNTLAKRNLVLDEVLRND